MPIVQSAQPGMMVQMPQRFGDTKGWFSKGFNLPKLKTAAIAMDWAKDIHAPVRVGSLNSDDVAIACPPDGAPVRSVNDAGTPRLRSWHGAFSV